jgi:hypothetical protein
MSSEQLQKLIPQFEINATHYLKREVNRLYVENHKDGIDDANQAEQIIHSPLIYKSYLSQHPDFAAFQRMKYKELKDVLSALRQNK